MPVVVVFTQFDLLVNSMYDQLDIPDDMPEEKIDELSAEKAQQKFQELCVAPLNKVNPELRYATSSGVFLFSCTECSIDGCDVWTCAGLSGRLYAKPDRRALAQLIEITQGLVEKEVEGEAWIVSAMAQRASAQGKINASIECVLSLCQATLADVQRARVGMKRISFPLHYIARRCPSELGPQDTGKASRRVRSSSGRRWRNAWTQSTTCNG